LNRRNGGGFGEQQFPLLPPREKEQRDDAEMGEREAGQKFQISARIGNGDGSRRKEGNFRERLVGKNPGEDERQSTQQRQQQLAGNDLAGCIVTVKPVKGFGTGLKWMSSSLPADREDSLARADRFRNETTGAHPALELILFHCAYQPQVLVETIMEK